jgi:hypothetical protein
MVTLMVEDMEVMDTLMVEKLMMDTDTLILRKIRRKKKKFLMMMNNNKN